MFWTAFVTIWLIDAALRGGWWRWVLCGLLVICLLIDAHRHGVLQERRR